MNYSDNSDSTPLEAELDAGLAKYAAVEPRAGLEGRILANLKGHGRAATGAAWWRWARVVAAALLITISLVWRLEKRGPQEIVSHPAMPHLQTQPPVAVKDTPTTPPPTIRVAVRKARQDLSRVPVVTSAEPKLDRFPAPQPLSSEELALARYARDFPQEALLIARAQEERETELQKQMMEAVAETEPSGSDQRNR